MIVCDDDSPCDDESPTSHRHANLKDAPSLVGCKKHLFS